MAATENNPIGHATGSDCQKLRRKYQPWRRVPRSKLDQVMMMRSELHAQHIYYPTMRRDTQHPAMIHFTHNPFQDFRQLIFPTNCIRGARLQVLFSCPTTFTRILIRGSNLLLSRPTRYNYILNIRCYF